MTQDQCKKRFENALSNFMVEMIEIDRATSSDLTEPPKWWSDMMNLWDDCHVVYERHRREV